MRPGKRRLLPGTVLGDLLEQIEHAKASIRAKVEHPFHVVKNLFGHRKTRYRGWPRTPPNSSRYSAWLIWCWLVGGY